MIIPSEKKFEKLLKKFDDTFVKLKQFNRCDFYSGKWDCYLELKARKETYLTYGINKDKYDYIIHKKNIRYLIWSPEHIISFNIRNIPEPIWKWELGPDQTEFDDEQLWYYRWVGYFPVEQGKDITSLLLK